MTEPKKQDFVEEYVLEASSLAPHRCVPTLSLKSFTEGSQKEQILFINNLFEGLKDFGFIILKDHGVSPALLASAYDALEEFFSLPVETKMKYSGNHGGQSGSLTSLLTEPSSGF